VRFFLYLCPVKI